MTKYVALNNIEHGDLKVANTFSGDDLKASVPTFPTEFMDMQREYPILFKKEEQGWMAFAVLGLKSGTNLFLKPEEEGGYSWQGDYVPATLARGPFLTGLREDGQGNKTGVVYIDIESAKVSLQEGLPLFKEHGGNSAYLDYFTKVLGVIQNGMTVAKAMYSEFERLDLFEPVTININLASGEKIGFDSYYTISEPRLQQLDGESLLLLNQQGFLQGAYLLLASLNNFNRLAKLHDAL